MSYVCCIIIIRSHVENITSSLNVASVGRLVASILVGKAAGNPYLEFIHEPLALFFIAKVPDKIDKQPLI